MATSSDGALLQKLIELQTPGDIALVVEANYSRMGVAVGSVALHVLARSAESLPVEERRALGAMPWFSKLLMQLGGQLAGHGDSDVQGLTCILWAFAQLEQKENQMVHGLVKRLLLLAGHGRVPPSQFVLATQALGKLGLLTGPMGVAVSEQVARTLSQYSVAQLGTLTRALAEGLGGAAEPLLRAVLASRIKIGRAHV